MAHSNNNNGQDLNNCRKTCSIDLFTQLINLLNIDLTENDYKNLEPYWTTCQYKCYRCSLNNSIQDMIALEDSFQSNKINTPYSTIQIATVISQMEETLETCYNQWGMANSKNDTTSLF